MPTRRPPRAPCRPDREPSLHERLIRALIDADERVCRNGFWQAIGNIVKAENLDDDELTVQAFRPDAYLIDNERQEINIVEVEVSHPLTDKKKSDYAWFWYLWECEDTTEWMPRLFVVDRYGHGNELDLRAMYYAKISAEAA